MLGSGCEITRVSGASGSVREREQRGRARARVDARQRGREQV